MAKTDQSKAPESRRPQGRDGSTDRVPELADGAHSGALWTVLALAVVGLALSVWLSVVHVQAHAGIRSFCSINSVFDCDRVAVSKFSVFLGLPVALWGTFGYGLITALAVWGLSVRRLHRGWPRGLLLVLSGVAVLASLTLALVSEFVIGAWCLLCMGSWAVACGLLVASWRACRGESAALVRADLSALNAHRGPVAALAAVGLLAVAGLAAAYPRYWHRGASGGSAPSGSGPVTIVEYSDYECPSCAKIHDQMREILADRPGVTLIHRQFPLDTACNSALSHQMHPSSCGLARAGICAESQGRLPAMEDALFGNQNKEYPVEALAVVAGLDMARFNACLRAPETDRRLQEDIAAAIRDGVHGTPTFVVGNRKYEEGFPEELLPPRSAGRRP